MQALLQIMTGQCHDQAQQERYVRYCTVILSCEKMIKVDGAYSWMFVLQAGPMQDLLQAELGEPLHSLVIVGNMHPIEEEMLASLTSKITQSTATS